MENENSIRVHRVGTITTGFSMIIFGVLFLLHSFFQMFSYEIIFHLWPIMLIGLGIELLLSNCMKRKFVYDKGAIILLMVMTLFVIGIAIMDISIGYLETII